MEAGAQTAQQPAEPPPPESEPVAAPQKFELSVEVGGAPVAASNAIGQSLASSKEFSKFSAAVGAAGLDEVFAGSAPLTVFAPLDKGFPALPKDLARVLTEPPASKESAALLRRIVFYHALAGKISAANLIDAIRRGGGAARFTTLEGEELTFRQNGLRIEITDARGAKALVAISDVSQKNGVIHVIDALLLPKS
ncbi:beta-Ig-H3/fasciclin [Methylocella silvestris BL2]|uniref:Beta-Ig-H3/fasciclin n=2 Tax=Methylocella silvestris TaxID=199596 RepID=B8EIB5_METSB|nr:beta-Ig-H3/fasciclin [Methylocella silvestris BL2]